MTTISQHHQAANSSNSAIKRHIKTIKDAKIAQDMARKLKLKAKAASKAIRKIQHTRKKTSRKSHSRRTVHCVSRGQKSKKPYVAQYKAIKGYKDGYEAARAKKSKYARMFIADYVRSKEKREKGWNIKFKNYYYGGTAKIYAYVETSSDFPIDDSAIKNNRFREVMVKRLSKIEKRKRVMNTIFEAWYIKHINKNLGRMPFSQAKKFFEEEYSKEMDKFSAMSSAFSHANKNIGKIEMIRWFKLIIR
jgi:hypothetical protein